MKDKLAVYGNGFFNYSYGRYFSNGVLVLTTLLLIGGVKMLLYGIDTFSPVAFLGLVLIVFGLSSYIPSEIFQINYKTNEYRVAVKVFSNLYGVWKPIGNVKYLSIITTNKSINLSGSSDGFVPKGDIIQECRLRLYKSAGYTIDIDDYKTKSSAIQIGRIISEGLMIPLLDASSKPATFI